MDLSGGNARALARPFPRYFEKSMNSKMLLKQMLLMTVFLGASMALVFYFIFQDSIRANSAPIGESAVFPEPEREGNPVRLIIPMIDVDSAFEYVGLTFGGAMDVPKNPINVAWFNLGPRPGEEG